MSIDTELTPTMGPWYVNQNGGAYEITTEPIGGELLGMFHDPQDAVLAAASPHMLEALIDISRIIENLVDADMRVKILEALNGALGKLWQEAS